MIKICYFKLLRRLHYWYRHTAYELVSLNPENNNTHKLGLTEQAVSNWHKSAECEWKFWIWEQL